jgi:hypothetical protein
MAVIQKGDFVDQSRQEILNCCSSVAALHNDDAR